MNVRWMVFALGVAACASTESIVDPASPDDSHAVPSPPALDSGLDATPELDAGPCADCEYFPAVCAADTLCPNGPFDSSLGGNGYDPRVTINVIRGRSATDVWAGGTMGGIAHFDGTSWTRLDLSNRETVRGLWLRDSGEFAIASWWVGYSRGLTVVDAGANPSAGGWTFTTPTLSPDLTYTLPGLPIPMPVTIAYARLAHAWSAPGSSWLWCTSLTGGIGVPGLTGLWRIRQLPSDELEIHAGVAWPGCVDSGCMQMRSIHGASADELWAVGESGAAVMVLDAEGDTPSVMASNTQTLNALNGVWVASTSDAWAVGANGTIRHSAGHSSLWDVVSDVPTSEALQAVWGSSSTDIWAVGDAGVVLHYDGKSWSRVKVAGLGTSRPNLTTVWVPAPGHVWVGGQGVILSLGGKP